MWLNCLASYKQKKKEAIIFVTLSSHDKPSECHILCDLRVVEMCPRRSVLLPVFLLIAVYACLSVGFRSRTVFGKLKSGFEMAGKLLGLDQHASSVAQLVVETFGKTHKKGDGADANGNIFSGFLRVLGFDSKRIGAIAVNAIIFMAQLISSSLSKPFPAKLTSARQAKEGSPFEWLKNTSTVINLLSHIEDKELPNHVINYIKENSLDEETDCVQLLVCKTAPFVWGMQKALKSNESGRIKGSKALYAYLPTINQVADNGDQCEEKHPFCFIKLNL